MKKSIILIISILIGFAGYTQSKKAEQIIENITSKTQEYESVKFVFTFTYDDPGSNDEVMEQGTLLISGDKYVLEIEGQTVICDGETIWTYIEDAWEVQINAVEEGDESITPSKLLTTYNEEYKARLDKEYKKDGVHYQRIELKPDEGKKWVKLDVVVNADKEEISKITIHDKNGGKVSYTIDEMIPDIEVDESTFTFNIDDYPDVEVVDMR